MRIAALLLILTFAIQHQHEKAVTVPNGFMAAKDFLGLTTSERRKYAMGFINGVMASPMLGADENRVIAPHECLTGMHDEQIPWLRRRTLPTAIPAAGQILPSGHRASSMT